MHPRITQIILRVELNTGTLPSNLNGTFYVHLLEITLDSRVEVWKEMQRLQETISHRRHLDGGFVPA